MPDKSDQPDPHTQTQTARRLTGLEEAAMFHEQTTADAREAAEEALRRIMALERRLGTMEERMGLLVQAEPDLPEIEKPPHSAG